ncbi:MAG: fasciclin domain-containing protein [Paludibacter sp.]
MENTPIINKLKAEIILPWLCRTVLIAGVVLGFLSCNAWKEDIQLNDVNKGKTLNTLVGTNPDISTFARILELTGYNQLLEGQQMITVFAPSNDALKNVDLTDIAALKSLVQNYIAYMSYYKNAAGNFSNGADTVRVIEMLNKKNITINASDIQQANIVGANGVLHIIGTTIENRKNILEYLNEQDSYEQVQFIQSLQEQVMDSAKSIQTGVDPKGKPLYDTVWTTRNTFLDAYPLADEQKSYTVVLLDNSVFDALKAKYAKYMYQKDSKAQNLEVVRQLTSDLVLKNTLIDKTGRYPSVGNVLVDIDPAYIIETYHASNGIVYKLSTAGIKMYENKIKTQIIEGENFSERWDGQSAWTTRFRSWASGGKDVMLKGSTRGNFSWTIHLPTKDSTATGSKTFVYTGDTYVQSKSTNAYIRYNPVMYSCDYEIYWVAYDNVASHTFVTNTGLTIPMPLEQKLLISFPGEAELKRETDGKITNNFSLYSAMAATSYAGTLSEQKLIRYRLNGDNNTSGSTNERLFLLDIPSDGTDAFGSGSILKCPAYGNATFFVANTTRSTASYAGLMFLDYIRLVPKVDIND